MEGERTALLSANSLFLRRIQALSTKVSRECITKRAACLTETVAMFCANVYSIAHNLNYCDVQHYRTTKQISQAYMLCYMYLIMKWTSDLSYKLSVCTKCGCKFYKSCFIICVGPMQEI